MSNATSKLTIECLDWDDNATDTFARLQHLPWATLLDTCNNTLSDGRFDIVVAQPIATIVCKNGKLVYQTLQSDTLTQSQAFSSDSCPFDVLDKVLAQFKESISVDQSTCPQALFAQLPFIVGALGFFGYDLNTQLDGIADADASANLPEYLADDFAVAIYDQSLLFDTQLNKVYYCHLASTSLTTQLQHKAKMLSPLYLINHWESNVTKPEYIENINQIHKYLRAGDCYQVNYAQRFSATYIGDEWEAYKTLRTINKAPFSAFIRHTNYSILSLSPERFIQVKDQQVETKPIKGTRPRSDDPIEDKRLSDELLNSEKDLAENLMIVDLLRNDLSKHCKPFSVKVPALFKLESYPAVHHMVSTVLGEIKTDSSAVQLLKGAFPGGSITGAPKVRSMQIIQELEPNKRSIYCGSIGFIGIKGDMDTSICIRTILAEHPNHAGKVSSAQKRMFCWAGGGIVLDSVAQDEYQESYDKVAKILPALAVKHDQ